MVSNGSSFAIAPTSGLLTGGDPSIRDYERIETRFSDCSGLACGAVGTQFLASSGLSALRYYLPGDPRDLNLVFVPTAADYDGEPYWLDNDRAALTRIGFNVRDLDIKGLGYEQSKHIVSLVDVVFVAGGNTFHLLNAMNDSGFGQAIKEREDLFYIGSSAGAAVAGPDIEPIAAFDRPELTDASSTAALGLVPFVVLPHSDPMTNGALYEKTIEHYKNRFEFVVLEDNRAVVVINGGAPEVVKSTRM